MTAISYSPHADARCPGGSHKSPSGDCEKVTHDVGLPRCPNGFHRSPNGDCERVSSGNYAIDNDSHRKLGSEDDDDQNDRKGEITEERVKDGNDEGRTTGKTSFFSNAAPISQSTECKGSADCFRGVVTEIVDGDTLDVNNVRVRLSMINTPEIGEPGYDQAKETAESECAVGSKALVDEDDGQKGGSFGRLIGVVYCNENNISLNEVLLVGGQAVLYEDFCSVSEFANEEWIVSYGC